MSGRQAPPLSPSRSRALISYFWITTFAVAAAQYAMQNVKTIIDAHGLRGSVAYSGIPFVFFLTLFRFSVGNLLHIRSLEKNMCLPRVWGLDFGFIFSESLVLLLLGMYTVGSSLTFIELLLILCFVDVVWILFMLIDYVRDKRPKPIPWAWGLLNISAVGYLGLTAWLNLPIPLSDTRWQCIFVVWFFVSFIIDVFLIDHYRLLHGTIQKPEARQERRA